MRYAPCLALALAALAPSAFAGPKEDAEASLALARALQAVQADDAAKRPIESWDEAQKIAKKTGKAMFVRVGDCDCSALCGELRPEVLTVHLKEWRGDARKKMTVVIPDEAGVLWYVHEWLDTSKLPKPDDVRTAIEVGRKSVKEVNGASRPANQPVKQAAPKKISFANSCECSGPLDCTCADGTCKCSKCVVSPVSPASTVARQQAFTVSSPRYVWTGRGWMLDGIDGNCATGR